MIIKWWPIWCCETARLTSSHLHAAALKIWAKAGFTSYHLELLLTLLWNAGYDLTLHWHLSWCPFFSFFFTPPRPICSTPVGLYILKICAELNKKKCQELVYEEDIFEHSSLTLTCGSILWDCSSPQAAIWKSRDKWRYAGRGTSGLFGVCTDRKCDGWEIYTQLGPDMDLYFGLYRPAKRAHYYMPLAGLFVCHA